VCTFDVRQDWQVRRDEIMKVLSTVKHKGIVVAGSAPSLCYCLPYPLLKSPGYNINPESY